ncbi:DUF1611 domain-containing protein [Dyadobacter sediminis]|uniref:DUF1611 domain-containing protein n=1 Tax=Dyadobacter sediminis TaxID=1493691 RepID=A0A5R9KIR2_9BACT|nr:DUF1611 domain-containing protein [Dyadobacter sediminis]TLU96110.1 DUF1611 domain-containing protein [Dyadobacter sediminis]GGB79337.1 hypothetical protein GCM10011325_03600 [Dyadobacter sediminis]
MDKAIILTTGLLNTADAKTAHGLIRESERFEITGVVDTQHAGSDAGTVLDGKHRNIPVFASVEDALPTGAQHCIIGVATTGGRFPDFMLHIVKTAIENGLSIVNGLHDYLSERPDISELARLHHVQLTDIRKPKKFSDLHFWTGEILHLKTPVVAIMGTDCALGKRTTTRLLMKSCSDAGIDTQMIYTGQTGWLQGGRYGFIFDSTLNDFVSGELENAILTCHAETAPQFIFLEGQSALRNPSGPCGAEFMLSGCARHVILVHSPKREFFDKEPHFGKIPSLETEMELIGLYGSKVIALALNTEDCTADEMESYRADYEERFGIPVLLPIQEGCDRIIPALKSLLK